MAESILSCPCPYREWPQRVDLLLLEAIDDAKQKFHAAQVDGDHDRRDAAERELDDLRAAWTGYRLKTSTAFLFGLRTAWQESPEALRNMLLDVLADPIAEALDNAVSPQGGKP